VGAFSVDSDSRVDVSAACGFNQRGKTGMTIHNSNGIQLLRKYCVILAVAIAAAGLVSQTASASTLLPGDEDVLAAGEPDPTGGVVIAGGVPVPFIAKTFSGTLTSTVIEGDPSNPYGGLTFTYQFTNDAKSPNSINRLTVQDFELALFDTDVSFQTDTGDVIPSLMGRPTADVVGWSFIAAPVGDGIVLPGSTSAVLVIQTNAKAWKEIAANVIDGSTANPASYGPAVPEPSSFALAGLGAIGLLVGMRRRSRRA
jgi:hypothetical protein